MDQTQLQAKIAEYYQKLPEETKSLFAGLSWLQTLEDINAKYSLNEEQIQTLGTETTILLLGIIGLEDYVQTLRTDLKIEDSTKIDNLLDEIGNKILKDIAPLLYDTYIRNTEDLEKEKLSEADGHKQILYDIGKKYAIPIDQMGEIDIATDRFLSGKISSREYEEGIRIATGDSLEKYRLIIKDINDKIITPKREAMMSSKDKVVSSKDKVPLPPYKSSEQEVVSSKDKVPLPPYVSSKQNVESSKEVDLEKIHEDIYREHGIDIISSNYLQKEEVVSKKPIDTIDKNLINSNIIASKLSGATVSGTTVADYSLPNINPKISDLPKMQGVEPSKPHDPYHEEI